jgi:hypothetical protein
MTADRKCQATTKGGSPCRARALPGKPFCLFHDPDRQADLKKAQARGGRANRSTLPPDAADLNLRTLEDCKQAMETAANEARKGVLDHRVAQVVINAADRVARIIQGPETERRVLELERLINSVLINRNGNPIGQIAHLGDEPGANGVASRNGEPAEEVDSPLFSDDA